MNKRYDTAPASGTEIATASWPRPTLKALPPLRDLTLQSAAISGTGSEVSGMSFLP